MATSTINPSDMEQLPAQEAAVEQQPQAPEMAEAVTVERLRDEVQATLARAETTRDRINSIKLSTGDTPRLQELKQQSEAVFKKIEQLVFAMMDTDRTIADQERLQALARSAQADLNAMNKPLQQATARAMEKKVVAKKRPAEPVAPAEPTPAPIEPPATPEPVVAAVEPTPAIEPEPAPEPVIIEDKPVEDLPKEEESYDRDAFWREMKSKLGERSAAESMQKKVQEQLDGEIQPELQRILKRIELGNSKRENPQQLISAIVALQAELGGEAYASQVRDLLEKWTDKPQDRTLFDLPEGQIAFSKINGKTGSEGLERSLRLAKAKKDTLGTFEGITNKLSETFGRSEVQTLEKRKRILLSAINLTMDKLIARMQDENKRDSLNKRKDSLSKTEESITRQVHFDRELADYIANAEELDYETQQALKEFKSFVLRLDPQARDLLADTLPASIPTEAADHMSSQQRQIYAQLLSNYEHLRVAFDGAVNRTRELYKGGVDGYERNSVTEALRGAQYEIEDDFSTATEDPALETPDRPRRLAEDDIERFAKSEVDIAREKALEQWTATTEKEVMDLVKKNHGELLANDPRAEDMETFLAYHMPNEGLRIIMLLNRLEGSIVNAETTDEIEDTVERKKVLLEDLDKILREQPLRKVIPSLDTRPTPRKPLDGMKTLSPEDAEIAEVNAKTDTKAPDYTAGTATLAPDYAKKQSGFDTIAPDYSDAAKDARDIQKYKQRKEQEDREYANQEFWKHSKTVFNIYESKFHSITHRDSLPYSAAWNSLLKIDALNKSGKKIEELTDEDKSEMAKAMMQLYDAFHPDQPFSGYADAGDYEIFNALDTLGIPIDEAVKLANQNKGADRTVVDPGEDRVARAVAAMEKANPPQDTETPEAEVIPFPAAEPIKQRVRKPLSAAEARAAAQRKPRKTPPRSVQSTRPPSVAA